MSQVNFTNHKPQINKETDNIKSFNRKPIFKVTKVSFGNESKKRTKTNKLNVYSPSNNVYLKTGYIPTHKIATTLQGSVYSAMKRNGRMCVIKRASVQLHQMGIACIDNKLYYVKENIVNEARIMKYLTEMNPPIEGLTKFIDYFCDGKNIFLLIEHGGKSFLEHTTNFHKKINKGELSLKVWKKHVKILFKQMCKFINWMHNIAKLAHLDISLENMLIKGSVFKDGKFISHGQIYFIDFGLATKFGKDNSYKNYTKFVGKKRYKAPEVYNKIAFDAFKADIWSMGVILFMMTFGLCPYPEPTKNDEMFQYIKDGNIDEWAKMFGKTPFVSVYLINLFSHIFCNQNNRWYIKKILKHRYLK